MYRRKNKGFTLVELLAVIVILAIILIIAVPGVLSIINQTKQKGYDSQLAIIKEAARNYVTAESTKIQWEEESDGTKKVEVTLQTLQDNGYLDKKIIDPRDKSEITCATTIVSRDAVNKMSYTMDTDCTTDESCFGFNAETGTITSYNWKCGSDVVIPKTIGGIPVTKIGGNAFWATQLTSVKFPDGLKEIGYYSFESNSLTSITIPDSVTTIVDGAFAQNQLSSVKLSKNVTTIGPSAFAQNRLTSVVIPDGVTSIGFSAFMNNQLTSVTIPNSVTTMGRQAFNGNQLPDDQAFIYSRKSDGLEDRTVLVSYGGARKENVIIPNGVITIGESAFYENKITGVTIPSSVTTIGSNAFLSNPLTSIIIKGKTALSEFTSLGSSWYSGSPTITFES